MGKRRTSRTDRKAKSRLKASRMPTCPDFELAPLARFDKRVLLDNIKETKDLNAFMLALSVVYNDYKGLSWMNYQLNKGKRSDVEREKITAYNGQWGGMQNQITKLSIGLLVELIDLIAKNKEILETPRFQDLLGFVNDEVKERWRTLADFALNRSKSSTDGKLYNALYRIRSNGTFHYYETKDPISALEDHMKMPIPQAEYLYASFGDTLEKTRFYFADAAIQKLINRTLEGIEIDEDGSLRPMTLKDLDKFFRAVNDSLRFIVEGYMRLQQSIVGQEP